MEETIKYCKCGCGTIVKKNYKKGHGRKGKKNSIEQNIKISESNKGREISIETREKLRKLFEGKKIPSERKIRISNTCKENGVGKWMNGKIPSEETRRKISAKNKGKTHSEFTKHKISIKNSGEKNGMFGKTHSEEYKKRLKILIGNVREKSHTPEAIEKRRLKIIGKKATENTRMKMRISKINYIKEKNGGICPMHNIKACEYFDELSKTKNLKLKHALNGGEFYLQDLGYFLDAYDSTNNVVVEYDEQKHYDSKGNLKEKDITRQNQIMNKLKCKFFRYNERKKELYEVFC